MENQSEIRRGLVVDLETSSLDIKSGKIIEIGIREFLYHRTTAEIVKIGRSYASLNDPKEPLSNDILQLTGINDKMLSGKQIEWDTVEKLFSDVDLVISHNASFDRPRIDRKISYPKNVVWGCTMSDINWLELGFGTTKLTLLMIYHGFFAQGHRAMSDTDGLLELLLKKNSDEENSYLAGIIKSAYKPKILIKISNTNFRDAQLFRNHGLRWNPDEKSWQMIVTKDRFSALEQKIQKLAKQTNAEMSRTDLAISENYKKPTSR